MSADSDSRTILQLAVAKCVDRGQSQRDIAKRLHLTEPTVSRLVRGNPYLTRPTFTFSMRDSHRRKRLLARMDDLLEQRAIRPILNALSPLPNGVVVTVVHDREERDATRSGSATIGFSNDVAEQVSKLIKRVRTVGVTWGTGILPPASKPPDFAQRDADAGDKPIRFIPLCGINSYSPAAVTHSSTVIAMRFDRLVNRGFAPGLTPLLNLNCIPLAHPQITRDTSAATSSRRPSENAASFSAEVSQYLHAAFPDYEQLYGSVHGVPHDRPLVDSLGMILTGLGTSQGQELGYLYPDEKSRIPGLEFNGKPLTLSRLRSDVIEGEIAGILLPQLQGIHDHRNTRITDQLNARLATLRAEHLLGCARRSAQSRARQRPPGVVVVARGEDKAESLLVAVRLGYVSRIIIDDALALRIEAIA